MIRTTLNWNIKNLKSMYDNKETLNFDHPIQRQANQWDNMQQSLLIHSTLSNYPIPNIYILKSISSSKDEKGKPIQIYEVLDGKQRMTTIFDYLDGMYKLHSETPSIILDDVEYEIRDKYFVDLEDDIQQEILRFKFQLICFEECDDDTVEEIFFRLNNSTPLSKPQKSKAKLGVSNAQFIDSILSGKFFTDICSFSEMQRRKQDDMCTLLQSMLLLDNKYNDYIYMSISADEVMKYSTSIKNNYSAEQKNRVNDIIDYLTKAFPIKDKQLKKINIPMLFIVADEAFKVGVKTSQFREWFACFIDAQTDYKQFCSSGSIKRTNTEARISIMSDHFFRYFNINGVADNTSSDISSEIDNSDTSEISIDNGDELIVADETDLDFDILNDDTLLLDEESDNPLVYPIDIPKSVTDAALEASESLAYN